MVSQKHSFKKRIIALNATGLIGLAVLSFCFYQFLIHSAEATRVENQLRINELNSNLARSEIIAQNHDELKNEIATLKVKSSSVRALVPNTPDDSNFIQQISLIAKDHSIAIKDFIRGNDRKLDELSVLPIKVYCEGTYTNLCNFFEQMESIPQLTNIENLKIKLNEETGILNVEIDLLLYFGLESNENNVNGKETI